MHKFLKLLLNCTLGIKEIEIFTNFLYVVSKFVVTKNCIVMVICLFRKGVSNVITMLRFLRCWHLSAALARKK